MNSSRRPFLAVFLLLVLAYCVWLLAFWPGVLGQDSLAVILQIEEGKIQSGKPIFWYLFVKWLYEPHRLIEVSVAVQLLLSAFIFARILAWCWNQGMRKTFAFILLFICLAPPVLYYQSALYSDGLFSAAVAGLTFEAWLIVRARRASAFSLAYLAVLAPIALFFRANGIFMLVILVPVLLAVPRRDKLKISAIFLFWLVCFVVANYTHKSMARHGTLFPLAIYETINFLQPYVNRTRVTGVDDLVTPDTITFLERRKPIREILAFYDRDYWDPLVYRAAGPGFLSLSKQEKALVVREFFCCNLWKNIPAFTASRVNIFLVAALAQGGFGGLDEVFTIVPMTQTGSVIRPFEMGPLRPLIRSAFDWSFAHRWLTWTPFLGIGLLVALMLRGWKRRQWPLLLLVAPLALQLGGIFFFSIAGEYRYLLLFFISAAALLPIYVATREGASPAPLPT